MTYTNSHTIRWTAASEGGRLAIRVRYLSFDEPKETIYFYPTAYKTSDPEAYRNLLGKKVIYESVMGCFQMRVEDRSPRDLLLQDGKGTKALHTIVRDIPPPKGRKNSTIEWRRGRWQSL